MPAYKLMYFNLKIRAEPMRVMFAEAGVKYEDCRISFEEWPQQKLKMPLGQLPVLMIDDMPLPQSGAIARYLAREFGLNGDSTIEEAYADMTWESFTGLLEKLPYMQSDKAEEEKKLNEALEKSINPVFERFEAKFKTKVEEAQDKQNCYFIGKKFTYADIAITTTANEIESFKGDFLDKFPTLRDHVVRKTEARPKIKAYLAKRS